MADMFEKQRRKYQERIDLFLRRRFAWLPARISLGILSWFGFVNLYMTRINLSVAIVAMVKRNESNRGVSACGQLQETIDGFSFNATNSTISMTSQDDDVYPSPTSMTISQEDKGEMLWDETTQGLVLGSFFYGYALTQIFGGRMAELYGTKMVYGICILGSGFFAILSPVIARLHYGAFIALRIIHGIFQGVSWPSMHALITRWIPPIERPKFVAIVYLAATLSSAITMPLCGVIIANHGWASQFYIMGSLSLLWCCVWFSFMYSTPEEHPRISPEELNYIQTSLRESGTKKSASKKIPWKNIFTSLPASAILIACIGNGWGISLLFAQLPTYMKNVLGFSIKANGGLSALPFLCRYIGGIMWSTLGSWLISRKYLSTTTVRRSFGIMSLWGPGVMILGVSFAGCNATVNVVLFCVALFCNGATTSSILVNHTDIAPNFAGTLLGIDNTVGSIIAFVVPVVTGIMTDGQQTIEAWQRVFWICVPIYFITAMYYVIFGSGEVQTWNDIDQVRAKKHKASDVIDKDEKDYLKPNV